MLARLDLCIQPAMSGLPFWQFLYTVVFFLAACSINRVDQVKIEVSADVVPWYMSYVSRVLGRPLPDRAKPAKLVSPWNLSRSLPAIVAREVALPRCSGDDPRPYLPLEATQLKKPDNADWFNLVNWNCIWSARDLGQRIFLPEDCSNLMCRGSLQTAGTAIPPIATLPSVHQTVDAWSCFDYVVLLSSVDSPAESMSDTP